MRSPAAKAGFSLDLKHSPQLLENGRLYVAVGDMLIDAEGIEPNGAISGNMWPGGVVYFIFADNVTPANQQNWQQAAGAWSAVSNVTFRYGTGKGNYLLVQSDTGNSCPVGMVGGPQLMKIASWNQIYSIAHEIGHALGLIHEQQRPDRASYVAINNSNIQSTCAPSTQCYVLNFDIWPSSVITYGLPYDFDSVMHYGPCFFSVDCPAGYTCATCSHYTITTNDPKNQARIGHVSQISSNDSAAMAQRYGPPRPTLTLLSPNGVAVPVCPVVVDSVPIGSTDVNGKIVPPSSLCGSKRVQARRGNLFYDAFVNFVCSFQQAESKGETNISSVQASSSIEYVIQMDSDGTCSGMSSLSNFSIGDVVEVFGTGNGLRARYPDPCSDSYATMPDFSAGTIVGLSQCCSGYIRWKIRYDGLSGIDAWSAEGESSTGQLFLRKKQNSTCSYSLAPGRLDLNASGAAASGFNVSTNSSCYWNAVSNQNWLSITTNGSGSGSKQVTFSVDTNTNASSRTGTITVADQIFTVTQPGTAGPTPTPTPSGALALGGNSVFIGKDETSSSAYVYNHGSGTINWSAGTDNFVVNCDDS